ncbi:MAG: HAD-superfamily hydrolase, subfamily variant 3 [Frankiales bacterium]|jgi:HAD superfamily hydrolase (TIGR01509 family)|nr:HAD-superfamily hydrolase, subfamily variant 3 [Frankiales bacterium]
MSRVDAVLFDWGGTLSEHRDVDLLEMWLAAARVLAPDDPEPVAQQLLAAEDHWWRVHVADGDRSGTTEDLLRSVTEETGLDAAAAAYHSAWGETVAHDPYAVDCLSALRAGGLRTGLLSNTHWPRDLHDAWLERDGLLDLLDVRMYTSEMTHMKPHPEAFLALCRELDVAPERCVFVGDRPRDDVAGAKGVGMRAVLMTGRPVPASDVVPDATLPDLRGLPELVASWR